MARVKITVTGTQDTDTVLEVLERFAVRRTATINSAAGTRIHAEVRVLDQLSPRILATRVAQALDENVRITTTWMQTHQYTTEELC